MSDAGQILVGALVGYVLGMFPSADLVARLASRGSVVAASVIGLVRSPLYARLRKA